jgi:hypothetical protein
LAPVGKLASSVQAILAHQMAGSDGYRLTEKVSTECFILVVSYEGKFVGEAPFSVR